MTDHTILDSSCRVALAAFLHDLGKFAERARISEAEEKDSDGNSQADKNKQLYCPHRKEFTDARGYYTHVHAAYTAIAIDLLEDKFPPLKGHDVAPFASWRASDTDDSLINAAAKHHTPDTFLQWIIATADRVASGFERETFEQYNQAEEGTSTGKTHYTARQLTLMEQICSDKENYQYRYALKPLSVESLFPVKAEGCERNDKNEAQAEYKSLWDTFVKALDDIPRAHRKDLSLWLDHFETLWGHFAHVIPSATAFNAKPDVSLYDHSRATAALATALWRYHNDRGDDQETTKKAMQEGSDWDENKFLLIQGDFFGIQNFIFSSGGETNKQAAKLLRGRSFYISLLSECAALKILQTLNLPATSQIINAAGKFLIVAPNTEQTLQALQQVQTEINQWFLEHSWGQAGIGFAWEQACCNDFRRSKGDNKTSPFDQLIKRLFSALEDAKYQRFKLCAEQPIPPVFNTFLDSFDNEKGVCQIDGRSPASINYKNIAMCQLAKDQIDIGGYLANPKLNRLMISDKPIDNIKHHELKPLTLDIFGFGISFTQESGTSGHFSPLLKDRTLLRFWDFSLPDADNTKCLWKGYAKRAINGFVPLLNDTDIVEYQRGKFGKLNKEDEALFEKYRDGKNEQIKNFNLIACEDRKLDDKGNWQGISALTTLKGDIDNLGIIFQQGLGASTFAKMAGLSRQINAFFTLYLPWLCQAKYENTYTVFAGGDDFFLIGPWQSQINLALELQKDFKRYVADNKNVHFSVGLSTTKPGMPIRMLAEMGEEALENAKSYNPDPKKYKDDPKNAVSCFSQVMFWDEFNTVMKSSERLQDLSKVYDLSTGYTYGLLELLDMASATKNDPAKSIWHSYFSYRTMRMLEAKKLSEQDKKTGLQTLGKGIAKKGIEDQGEKYRVALFNYLYQKRS